MCIITPSCLFLRLARNSRPYSRLWRFDRRKLQNSDIARRGHWGQLRTLDTTDSHDLTRLGKAETRAARGWSLLALPWPRLQRKFDLTVVPAKNAASITFHQLHTRLAMHPQTQFQSPSLAWPDTWYYHVLRWKRSQLHTHWGQLSPPATLSCRRGCA